MKKTLIPFFFTCFCCIFLILLLFYSKECISLASNGLLIWYHNMIPSLFPFMVLSGFIIRCGLSVKIGQYLQPILGIFFRLPSPMLYVIFMGFLCGFPMGAKMVADMLEKKQITPREGEYLLAFCNNIGPLYMLGYVIPLFEYKNIWKILGFMYLVPLSYGLYLHYFSSKYFFKQTQAKTISMQTTKYFSVKNKQHHVLLSTCSYSKENSISSNYLVCFQQSLSSAIEQITMLGGCMIFFNCLQIFPKVLGNILSKTSYSSYSPLLSAILSSLIEIGGGLQTLTLLSDKTSYGFLLTISDSLHTYLPLALLTFGGLSCITQTCFILKNTGLKISTYIKHKFLQTCIFIIFIFIQ